MDPKEAVPYSPSTTPQVLNPADVWSLWAPRMTLGGVEYHDLETIKALAPTWMEWIDVWSDLGGKHRAAAEELKAAGSTLSAGHAFRRAAACYHFAKFVWAEDEQKNGYATEAAVSCTRAALHLLDPSHRRITAENGEFKVVGYLRFPVDRAASPYPLVVLVPGTDSTKEEFPSWETVILDRGLACLTLDGPGQGEVFHMGTRMQPAYEQALALGLDAVASDSRIDMNRIGIAGTSLGGYYVVRGAAFETRVKALVSISGPMSLDFDALPAHTRATMKLYSRSSGDQEARAYIKRYSLEGLLRMVKSPALIATGKMDRIVPWQHTKAIADGIPKAAFRLYEDGNHALTNVAYEFRDISADWLKAALVQAGCCCHRPP
jgi:dipeptidyl aminopeptidase/acylaminoacyl peptidase